MTEVTIFELSSRTAIVGMSVVFVALFLLSAYMHYFKELVNKLESSKKPPSSPQQQKPPAAPPASASATAEAGTKAVVVEEGEKLAAVIAAGLALKGVLPVSDAELAAVIGTALYLEEKGQGLGLVARETVAAPPLNWAMAGRLMAHRLRHQSGMRAFGNIQKKA